jgi:uncharacterized protein (DUF2141 family)
MLLIGTLTYGLFGQEQTGTLIIEITKLRNNKGQLMMSMFDSKDGFPTKTDKANKTMKIALDQFEGSPIIEDLPYGVYAVSIFHDENSNKKPDFFIFVPSEGTAASNDAKGYFGPPSFKASQFRFNLPEQTIVMTMNY